MKPANQTSTGLRHKCWHGDTNEAPAISLWFVQNAIHSFLHPIHRVLTQENGTMTAPAIQADRLGNVDRADIESMLKHLLLIA